MAQDPEPEEIDEQGEIDPSSDLDMVTLFSSSNHDAEMEVTAISTMLQAAGIATFVVGPSTIPSLEFQVQVPRDQLGEAKRLLEEAKLAGPEAAAEAEAAEEAGL
jgi:hypothetical protein